MKRIFIFFILDTFAFDISCHTPSLH
jgi:hypothetical protein